MHGSRGMGYSVFGQLCTLHRKMVSRRGEHSLVWRLFCRPAAAGSIFIKPAKSAANKGMSSRQAESSKINRHNSDFRSYIVHRRLILRPVCKMPHISTITKNYWEFQSLALSLPLKFL